MMEFVKPSYRPSEICRVCEVKLGIFLDIVTEQLLAILANYFGSCTKKVATQHTQLAARLAFTMQGLLVGCTILYEITKLCKEAILATCMLQNKPYIG